MAPRAAAAAAGFGLLAQAAALTDSGGAPSGSVLASALDVGRCLGLDAASQLALEPCLDGAGKAWSISPEDDGREGPLRIASDPNSCVNAETLKLEPCDGSSGQQGWSWSRETLQLMQGSKCLMAGFNNRVAMMGCEYMPPNKDGQDWSTEDQNGEGAPAVQTWIVMPASRPQIDILSDLHFPLRVSGRYVIDAAGTPVKLVGVNWIGAHLSPMVQYGLNYITLQRLAKYVKHMGFNHVRMSYALSMLHEPGQTISENPRMMPPLPEASAGILKANPELEGLSSLEVFDRSVKALTDEGLLVILNNHMSNAGWCCSTEDGNGLWYNEDYTTEDWLNALTFMTRRYADNPRVFAHDIRNEPRPDLRGFNGFFGMGMASNSDGEVPREGPSDSRAPSRGLIPWWGLETGLLGFLGLEIVDWRRAASQGAVAVWNGNAHMNVVVEGNWFASNLAYARSLPLSLAQDCLKSRTFYSVHEYPWYSLIYNIWEYLVNPFRAGTMMADLKTLASTEQQGTKLQKKHPLSEIDYERFKETREAAGWNLLTEGFAPVWVSEFGTGRRSQRNWYRNVFKFFGEVDADWSWWPLDVDKMPVGVDPEDPDGEMDAAGIFNPGLRNYHSVVGWKLQDMIAIMGPKPDYPRRLEVPEECLYDAAANAAAADAPTNNLAFFTTIHWTWYLLFWSLFWLLLLCSPCLCCCCCGGWWHYRNKRRAVMQDYEAQGLLVDPMAQQMGYPPNYPHNYQQNQQGEFFDGRVVQRNNNFWSCCRSCERR